MHEDQDLHWNYLRFFKKINLFIYWLHWVFVAVHGLSLVVARTGAILRCGTRLR